MATIAVRRMDMVVSRWSGLESVLQNVFGLHGGPSEPPREVTAGETAGEALAAGELDTAAAIDRCYDELAELVSLRGGPQAGPALEEKIAAAFQELRSLQHREAEETRRQALSRLSLPLRGGADHLAHIDEILARYEDPTPDDPSAAGADPQEA